MNNERPSKKESSSLLFHVYLCEQMTAYGSLGAKTASLGQNGNFDERKDKFGTSLSHPILKSSALEGQLPLILV